MISVTSEAVKELKEVVKANEAGAVRVVTKFYR